MILEEMYYRIDWNVTWMVLRQYRVRCCLVEVIENLHKGSKCCVRAGEQKEREEFQVRAGLIQRCVISPRLFNMYMDGVVKEVKMVVMEGWWL